VPELSQSSTAPLEVRVRIGVRWRDLDMLGHLNQAVYHELLEEGRAELIARLGQFGTGTGFAFVVARVELDYRHEVRRDHGHVDVVVTPSAVGRSSITVAHSVLLPDGTVAAEGVSVLVAWDPAERRSRVITDAERALLQDGIAV
jgi:acyl-CoA thioester hydrolase